MRKQRIAAAAVLIVFFSAVGAAAQGPQGAGAEKAAQSSNAPRSYNPIKWIKKNQSTTAEKPKKVKEDKKPSEKSATPDTHVKPPTV